MQKGVPSSSSGALAQTPEKEVSAPPGADTGMDYISGNSKRPRDVSLSSSGDDDLPEGLPRKPSKPAGTGPKKGRSGIPAKEGGPVSGSQDPAAADRSQEGAGGTPDAQDDDPEFTPVVDRRNRPLLNRDPVKHRGRSLSPQKSKGFGKPPFKHK